MSKIYINSSGDWKIQELYIHHREKNNLTHMYRWVFIYPYNFPGLQGQVSEIAFIFGMVLHYPDPLFIPFNPAS